MIYFIKVILVIKDFKTISQQVEILKNKGLIIDDVNKAENILLKDEFTDSFVSSSYEELKNKGLEIELAPYEFKIYSVDF